MEGLEVAGWPRPRRAARPWTAARNPDRGWSSRGPARQGARPGRRRRGGENPLHLIDPAEVGAADQEPRCAVADSLSARVVDRRLPGGAQRTVGKGRTQPVSGRDRTADGGVAGRLRCLAEAELSPRRYVYVWADGVYLQARMEESAECMLVMIGATPEGKKELVGFQTGVRESAQSWREL